jgi:O-succinylbenzoic acid--CoA ligase
MKHTLPYQNAIMPEWLGQRALLTPDRLALVCGQARIRFAELERLARFTAKRLADLGVLAGQRVALLSGNSLEFVLAVHALPKLGGILVPLNTRLAEQELAWQLADAGASLLLYDEPNADKALLLARKHPQVRAVSLKELPLPLGPTKAAERSAIRLSQVHSILYTSGTTGTPKGAMLTYGNHFFSAMGSALNLGVMKEDCWLASLPLYHVGGLSILLRSVIYGIPTIVLNGFDPEAINRAIDEDGVSMLSVVAVMLKRILDARVHRPFPGSLRCVLVGGGPVPISLLEDAERLGSPVVQTYGLTEAASQVTTLSKEDALSKQGSAGKPLFSTEVSIVDTCGRVLGPEQEGEILVRGPVVMAGYFGRPKETAEALRGGWLHTGDIGSLDKEGYLYVLDRRCDLIVSGGENIYPAEVEAALLSHPCMLEAGVIGVPDTRWGQAVAAFLLLRDGERIDEAHVKAFLKERLAVYKVPAHVRFVGSLPRNASGKLLRHRLREAWNSGPS